MGLQHSDRRLAGQKLILAVVPLAQDDSLLDAAALNAEYSPEYGSDEYLNNDLKQSIGAQAIVQNVQELEENTSAFMGQISDNPNHIKSYFDHPSLDKYKLN